MNLEKLLYATECRISESSKYLWECYGENARIIDFAGPKEEESMISAIFDSKTRKVFEVNINTQNAPIRWIDPEYIKGYQDESADKNIDFNNAWDDVEWTNLDTEESILIKIEEQYNTKKCIVAVDLDDATQLALFKIAHKQGISIDELVNDILKSEIAKKNTKKTKKQKSK